MKGDGHAHHGDPGMNMTVQQVKNAAGGLARVAEAGVSGTSVLGTAMDATSIASASASYLDSTIENGCKDYNSYEGPATMHQHFYTDAAMDWSQIDWHQYDEGGTADCATAMHNLFEDADH